MKIKLWELQFKGDILVKVPEILNFASGKASASPSSKAGKEFMLDTICASCSAVMPLVSDIINSTSKTDFIEKEIKYVMSKTVKGEN